MPKRMAALPHALENVLSTMRFGYASKSSRNGFCPEKSAYASSMTTIPGKRSSTLTISSRSKSFPEGLFGEQRNTNFVCSSATANNLSASNRKPSSNKTGR